MEEYEIRYATVKDIPAIKKFIDDKWKKDHILVREDGLFEWQYTSDKLDYVIAIDSNDMIQGMIGFISYDDSSKRDIATSMWKANPGTGFLGIKLLMYIQNEEKHRTLFSPGINVGTSAGIYKRMKILTGKMNQWYRLNAAAKYQIAKVEDSRIPDIEVNNVSIIKKYNTFEEFTEDFNFDRYVSKESVPYKSISYLKRRYFCHPMYKYMSYGIKMDGVNTNAVFFLRVQEYNGARVIRFVDCVGYLEALTCITPFLDNLLDKEHAEYIDMYEKGVPEGMLRKAGWKRVDETNNIIPNYFSPYVQCNVDINYCTTNENIILFRGDGDQDRPN